MFDFQKHSDFLQLLLDTQNQDPNIEKEEEQDDGASQLVKTADKINEQMSRGMKKRRTVCCVAANT